MKRYHICFYKNGEEVININDLRLVEIYEDCVVCDYYDSSYVLDLDDFDSFKVDIIND